MQIIDCVAKARRIRYARHTASTGWVRILSENLKRRNHVERLGVDSRIILKWTLKR
jgi:hypothetical protein